MADLSVTVQENRVIVQPFGSELLTPLVSAASVSAAAAEVSAGRAEAVAGTAYADTAAGLAATAEGEWFAVDSGGGIVTTYKHSAGPTATDPRPMATTGALAASTGPGLIGFSHAETYAAGTLGRHARGIRSVTDAPYNAGGAAATDDYAAVAAAVAAVDTSGGKGGTVKFPTGVFLSSATVLPREYTFLQGDGFRSSIINATFTGAGSVVNFREVTDSGLSMVRLGLNTNAAGIGLNVEAPAASVSKLFVSNIEFGGAAVDGQIGLNLAATSPNIITESVFANLMFLGCDTAIKDRESEGNFFPCLTVDQFGYTTAGIALDLQTHANYYQGRIAGTTVDGSTGYKQTGTGNIAVLVADFGGGSRKALDVADNSRDIIILQRPEGLTPLGTVGYNNTVIDRAGSMFPHINANGKPATIGQFTLTDWGSTAAVSDVVGTDQCVRFTVTSGGTGQAAYPYVEFAFNETWTKAPMIAFVQRCGGNQNTGDGLSWFSPFASTTIFQFRWGATPVAGEAYTFTVMLI